MNFQACPSDWFLELERFRLQSRRSYRPNMSGGHLMRRRGQSLEFREFTNYTPGDDVRHIDWRASARAGDDQALLIRKFAAEESMTLVISIDIRETMRLPETIPKLQVACWIAESLARVALRNGDRVLFHPLFGKSGEVVSFRGANSHTKIVPALERFCQPNMQGEGANLAALTPILPPTAVWLVLSDFYFELDRNGQAIVRQLAAAKDGLRWVMLADLDAWPFERTLLGLGARRIEGPEVTWEDNRYDIDAANLERLDAAIAKQKAQLRDLFQGQTPDWTHWAWPGDPESQGFPFFKQCFGNDPLFRQLFMKAS